MPPPHTGRFFETGEPTQQYNRVGLALAVFASLCFFTALWVLNGYFTSRTIYRLGQSHDLVFLSWGTGWLIHLVISLIEQHLWKLRTAVGGAPGIVLVAVYTLVVIVGVVDVLTSSLAFLELLATARFSPIMPATHLIATLLSEVIAIIPEPLIIWLSIALWRIVQDEEVAHG